jgi:DNA adenine methylase
MENKTEEPIARPFLKWAGGKRQLLENIARHLPREIQSGQPYHYAEPFVGSGAVFFMLASRFPKMEKARLNDINQNLVMAYQVIRDNPGTLIKLLEQFKKEYIALDEPARKKYFLQTRTAYNHDQNDNIRQTAYLIFLNHTCFNGLFRVNSKGHFNVPHGKYKNPRICDKENIMAVSRTLKEVKITRGDFGQMPGHANNLTFYYLDPPYKPLSKTSSFTSYDKTSFLDEEQVRLKKFCDKLHSLGHYFMLSNSDPRNHDPSNTFFHDLYTGYHIHTVKAKRAINSNGKDRGAINELLITNY